MDGWYVLPIGIHMRNRIWHNSMYEEIEDWIDYIHAQSYAHYTIYKSMGLNLQDLYVHKYMKESQSRPDIYQQ